MCGILAIITKDPNHRIHAELARAQSKIVHRGPDNQASIKEDGISLGHNRLSIFDLSESANQPMEKDDLLIIYNGAIYNFIELREELKGKGHSFTTDSDTELILEAYRQWGEACLSRFNGMWAFVLYDRKKQVVFCSRDRFGIKPLYLYEDDEKFVLASEQKAIQQLVPSTLEIHHNSIRSFLESAQTHFKNASFYKGIRQLPAGVYARLNLNTFNLTTQQYYFLRDLGLSTNTISFNKAKDEFRSLFFDAVKLRLRADVNIGAALSGGIDSNSICAVTKMLKPDVPLDCISACFKEKGANEIEYIQDGIDRTGHNWHPIYPNSKNLLGRLRLLAWFHDQPIVHPSVLAQFEVFNKAKQLGLKVMLDGQGADEILYGYDNFLKLFIKQFPLRSIVRFPLLFLIAKRKMQQQESQLDIIKNRSNEGRRGKLNLHESALINIEDKVLPSLLHFEDRNSMAHGIESRVPFLDHRLLEFCLDLPMQYFFNGAHRKYILKESLKDLLPKSIYERKDKMPFSVPQTQWQNDNRASMKNLISRSKDILDDYLHIDELDKLKLDSKLAWRIVNLILFIENREIAKSNLS